jgi:hypothetical protein
MYIRTHGTKRCCSPSLAVATLESFGHDAIFRAFSACHPDYNRLTNEAFACMMAIVMRATTLQGATTALYDFIDAVWPAGSNGGVAFAPGEDTTMSPEEQAYVRVDCLEDVGVVPPRLTLYHGFAWH